ncbi:MAG: DNA topoisomerase VI subunit B, partial [Desulfurococcales archaeon]|nr:DNA topoisomerase VI subunit B [Desulfurococcales archaeon]
VPEIEREIIAAIREVARKLKMYLSKKRKEMEAAEKAVTIAKYIPEVAQALAKIVDNVKPEDLESRLLALLNQKLKAFKIRSVDEVVVGIE